MTGGSDTQSKLRAALLAFVMVTSMMVGTVALTGTAAAGVDSLVVSTSSDDVDNTGVTYTFTVNDDGSTQNVESVAVDFDDGQTNNNFDGSLSEVSQSDVTVEIDTTGDGNFETTAGISDFGKATDTQTEGAGTADEVQVSLNQQFTIAGGDNNGIRVIVEDVKSASTTGGYDSALRIDPSGDPTLPDGDASAFTTTVSATTAYSLADQGLDQFSLDHTAISSGSNDDEAQQDGVEYTFEAQSTSGGPVNGVKTVSVDFAGGTNNPSFDGSIQSVEASDITVDVDTDGGGYDTNLGSGSFSIAKSADEQINITLDSTVDIDGSDDKEGLRVTVDDVTSGTAQNNYDGAILLDTNSDLSDGFETVESGDDQYSLTDRTINVVTSGTETADNNDDATVDTVQVTLNEQVDDAATNFAPNQFSLSTGTVESVTTGATADDAVLQLGVSGFAAEDTGVTDSIDLVATASANALVDKSGSDQAGGDAGTTVSDGAAPVVLRVEKSADTQVDVFYSETIDSDDSGDYTYVDNNGVGATTFNKLTASKVGDLSQINLASTDNPISQEDINSDQVSFASGAGITDSNSNNLVQAGSSVLIQNPSGFSLQGDSNNEVSTDIGGSATQVLRAGSADQELDLIRVKDISGGGSPLSARTILEMPDGVTINESATDVLATTTSGDLSVTGTQIVDENTLRLEHSGSSENGQLLRVSGVAVDVAPNVSASQSGVANDITVDFATGNLDTALVTAEKPQIQSVGGSSEAVSAGTNDQDLTDSFGDIRVQTGSNVDGQIANQSAIVINANASNGITFDTDVDPTTLTATTTGNAEVDMSAATLTEDALTIPVTAHFDGGDRVDIDTDAGDDLLVDVAGDAANAKFSGTVVANSSTGDVALEQSTQTPDLNVQNPDISIDDSSQNLAVGLDEQILNEGTGGLDESAAAIAIEDTSGGQMAAGENVTIRLNSSEVTFDTSRATQLDTNNNGDGVDTALTDISDDGTLDAAIDDGSNGDIIVDAVTINENSIEVSLADNGESATDSGDILELGDVGLNVSTTAGDEADVEFEAVTRSGAAAPDVTSTSTSAKNSDAPETGQFLTLKRPRFELSGNNDQTVQTGNSGNITLDLDGDGFTNNKVSGGNDALVLDQDSIPGMIADTTNVTVTLEDNTGVTFDTSASTDGGFDASDSEVSAQVTNAHGITVTDVTISQKSLTVELTDDETGKFQTGADAQLDGDSAIAIDSFILNATGSAQRTEISVTTNATVSSPDGTPVAAGDNTRGTFTSPADNEVTTTLSNVIEFNTVDPTQIRVDPDTSSNANNFDPGSFTFGADQQVDKPDVTNTISSGLEVQDGGSGFGDATVNLEIIETPNGSSGAQLNTTQVSTNSNGNAFYNFTAGDTAGDYVVNATVEQTGAGVNVTYTAQPGGIDGVTVTPIENAIAQDGTGDTAVAALFVNSTDANGNRVTGSSPTVEISANNVGSSEVDSTDNFENTKGDVSGINSGTFSLDSADGSSVIYVKSSQVEDVTISATISGNSDSGTVTFFDQVSQIDLALNQSTVEIDDTVAAEATLSESDGTTIEVPDVTVNYDDNNNGNTTFDADADAVSATTSDAGVASVNVTAEQLGSSTIDAQSNLRSDNATLNIVENAGAQVQLANVNLDPSSVSANTTNDHNLTFDAVNVSDDGNTDSFTVTIPSAATLESANSVSVVDANGTDVSLSGGPDVSGNEITFDVAPDSSADTRTLSVTANVTVAAPDVENETTADITVDVSDSNNGQASANATLTIQPAAQQQPVAAVTFDDQTVPNGTSTITVESANFTRANGSAGDYVVVVHTIDEFGAPVGEVSAPIGASGDLTGAEENITVDLTAADGPINNITENVTLRAMLHTTDSDSAFGTRLGSAIDGLEPGDETDDANITVQDEPASDPVEQFDTNGEPGIQDDEVLNAISAFNEGEEGVEAGDVLDVISAFNEA